MRFTWFGETALRLQLSGQIFTVDADLAPKSVDRRELGAATQKAFALRAGVNDDLTPFDAATWSRPRAVRLIERDESVPVALYRTTPQSVLLVGSDESPLAVIDVAQTPSDIGPWANGAVIVAIGEASALADFCDTLLGANNPRLLALAVLGGDENDLVARIGPKLGEASLQLLEAGLAVEV